MLAEFCKWIHTFTFATSHHVERRLTVKDHGKHVNAGIAASASGLFAPLFLIATGKKVMSRWLEPLKEADFTHVSNKLAWLTKQDWCPPSTMICVTEMAPLVDTLSNMQYSTSTNSIGNTSVLSKHLCFP